MSREGLSVGAPEPGLFLSRRSPAAICTSQGLTAAGISPIRWNLLSAWRGHWVTFAHLCCLSCGGAGGTWRRRSEVSAFLMGRREQGESSRWLLCPLPRQQGGGAKQPVPPSGPCSGVEWMRLGLSCGELRPCSFSSCGWICWAVGA